MLFLETTYFRNNSYSIGSNRNDYVARKEKYDKWCIPNDDNLTKNIIVD